MFAYRNLRLCSKDCMCLYVCPTGATDTETGQIDFDRCIGCGRCAQACPGGAISLIPERYPRQKAKDPTVVRNLRRFSSSKAAQEVIAADISEKTDDPLEALIADTLKRSNRLMAEDLARESGYMLPQSGNVRRLLETLVAEAPEGFPVETARKLLERLEFNE